MKWWWFVVIAACEAAQPEVHAEAEKGAGLEVHARPEWRAALEVQAGQAWRTALEVQPKTGVDAGLMPEASRLQAWLLGFHHRRWTAMTELRATGEHGGEQLFFNDVLAASWRAGAAEFPIGSAAVRELYEDDLTTLKGFAAMRKVAASGVVGEGWYWFEVLGTTMATMPTVAEFGARACAGCHSHAVDFVHSPATPRVDPPTVPWAEVQ